MHVEQNICMPGALDHLSTDSDIKEESFGVFSIWALNIIK